MTGTDTPASRPDRAGLARPGAHADPARSERKTLTDPIE